MRPKLRRFYDVFVSAGMTYGANLITFRGIKSGPVAFLGFLSLTPYFTIETTTLDKRRRVLMMGKARRRKGAQFSRLPLKNIIFTRVSFRKILGFYS